MPIKLRGYRLDSCKFYPKPNHFKERLNSLIPRFKNVIGAFGEPFHDQKWLHKIDDNYSHMSKPIVVSLIGDEKQSFDLNRFVIHEADEWATVLDPFSTSTFERAGLYITVCYITVEDVGAKGKETVQRVIDHVSSSLNQCSNDHKLFKSLFVCCELLASNQCTESEKNSFLEYINGCLLQRSTQWPGSSRVVLGPDNVILRSIISEHIEKHILHTFCLINEYLNNRVVHTKTPHKSIHGNLAYDEEVEQVVVDFVRNDIKLAEMRQQLVQVVTSVEDNISETAFFVDNVINHFANKLKCVLVNVLSAKMGLNIAVCNTCLDEISFDTIISKCFSMKTRKQLERLHEFSNNHTELLQKVSKECRRRKLYKGNDYMIRGLQNDLSAALFEIETELMKKVKQISIVGKMADEIEGYFRKAKQTTTYLQQNNHLKTAEVVDAGKITQGSLITSLKRSGTLGMLANAPDTKRLYGLTSAHVVNTFGVQELPVYVKGLKRKIGVSKPELTVPCSSVTNAPLIDIAAVEIDHEVQGDCFKKVKKEDGLYATSFVPDISQQDLEKQVVYKYGATSGLTHGIVLSNEKLAELYSDDEAGSILAIDSLAGTNESFAQPGDSGSIVCLTPIDRNQVVDSVAVVAMVSGGELKLKGYDKEVCLAFQLKKALEALKKKSGFQLETP